MSTIYPYRPNLQMVRSRGALTAFLSLWQLRAQVTPFQEHTSKSVMLYRQISDLPRLTHMQAESEIRRLYGARSSLIC